MFLFGIKLILYKLLYSHGSISITAITFWLFMGLYSAFLSLNTMLTWQFPTCLFLLFLLRSLSSFGIITLFINTMYVISSCHTITSSPSTLYSKPPLYFSFFESNGINSPNCL
eukprot:NODE_126_length_18761_cov_0.476262.p10 type:complete len:113 gc:universal NODE_126_length_18761_cov_0.476262:15440-15102(-)